MRPWVLVLLMLACAHASAWHGVVPPLTVGAAGEYLLAPHLAVVEDRDHRLTVAEVAGLADREFRRAAPRVGDVNFGYSSSAFWLALPLRVERTAPAAWLLEFAAPSIDSIEVYQPRAGGGYSVYRAGDHQPFAARPYAHRNLVFPLHLMPGADQTVYIRVVSGGTLTLPATLWQPETLRQHDQQSYALLALYYGMLLALFLYNLLLWLATRDTVFLAYVAFCGGMAIGQCSLNGFGNQFLWPESVAWGNHALPFGMSATGFFGALFTRLFLETPRRAPRLDRVIVVLAASFALSALTTFVASYRVAAIFTSLNGLVFSAISAHAVPLFSSLGFGGEQAVFMAALIGPSQVASRLGDILLGRRLSPMHLGLIAFGLLPLAVGLFALMGFSWPAAIVFAVLYGAANGLVTIAKGAVPLSLFGTRGYGEVLGVISAPNLILNAAAPLLFALLLGVVSPQASLLMAGGIALASTLFMLWLARLHPQQA